MSVSSQQHAAQEVRGLAEAAKAASRVLAALPGERRDGVLDAMAHAVEQAEQDLLNANAEDLAQAQDLPGTDALSPATLDRLKLTSAKVREMAAQIRSVRTLPDPLGRTLEATELDDGDPLPASPEAVAKQAATGLHLTKVSVPLGVLAVIFEARPDAVTQIASLAIKSGNAVVLKPGREVARTAQVLVNALRNALASLGLPKDCVAAVYRRESVDALLQANGFVDMVIPRGSKSLVEYVQSHTSIPVLGHAEGVCHIYVDRAADPELALRVIEDAKTDYPAACNAVETVLVHRELAPAFLPRLAARLQARGVQLQGDEATRQILPQAGEVADWHTEYGELALSVGVVGSIEAAIAHIHAHGSAHTESILTEDGEAAERFLREVDAAGVFHNCSTRFADGFRYGFGAEVGISTSKLHARGPVGLEGLTTYKYLLRGQGHAAGDYRGPGARRFTHRRETIPR